MKWNYGIVLHLHQAGNSYAVHSIYRDGDKISWSEDPTRIVVEDILDIDGELQLMLRDCTNKEVIVVNAQDEFVEQIGFQDAVKKYRKGTEVSSLNNGDGQL